MTLSFLRPGCRRGFSIMEVTIGMVILAVLAGLGLGVYSTVENNMDRVSSIPALSSVQLEARRVLASSGDTTYPAGIVSALDVPGVTVVSSPSGSAHTVSGFLFSGTVLVLASGSAGGCTILVDRLTGEASWLVDRDLLSCSAQGLAGQVSSEFGGTASEPLEVTLS